jgi:sugar phosphate isomerase/epimerase
MIQLGLVSAILPEFSLDDVMRTCAAEGYECVEVMAWPHGPAERRYAGVTHLNAAGFGDAESASVKELSAKHGIAISGIGYYPNLLSPDAGEASTAVEHLKRVIAAAGKLGVSTVNTFVGRDWTKSIDGNWPRFRAVWPDLIKLAEDSGVRVAIENCPMLFTADEWPGGKNLAISPVVWRRMFDEIPSDSFGLNYDPSHLVWQMMDPVGILREFAPKLFHVHAKDARVDRRRLEQVGILAEPLQYHSPKLPGLGEVNWSAFFAELTAVGYRGPVCVEVEDRAYEHSLEARITAVRQSHGYLRQFCPRAAAA